MPTLLKIVIAGLLLLLLLALGTEVVALRGGQPLPLPRAVPPVVVRKVPDPTERPKTVRPAGRPRRVRRAETGPAIRLSGLGVRGRST